MSLVSRASWGWKDFTARTGDTSLLFGNAHAHGDEESFPSKIEGDAVNRANKRKDCTLVKLQAEGLKVERPKKDVPENV